jgi:hypothetical protein
LGVFLWNERAARLPVPVSRTCLGSLELGSGAG